MSINLATASTLTPAEEQQYQEMLARGTPTLTVLSYGAGQDSTALLYLYVHDDKFREKYAPNDFLVLLAETGDEHDPTNEYVEEVKQYCIELGIPFVHITPDMGFHSKAWLSLSHFYDTHKTVGSKAFPKSCTHQLKLVPIYNYLALYLATKYAVIWDNKKGYYDFARRYGKIRMLIGIAKGEDNRVADASEDPDKWKRENVEIVYPLRDLGLDRAGCQRLIRSYGYKVPFPSNCRRCPFMSLQELVWMYRFIPDVYHDWVRQERAKLENNQHKGKDNLGVWGKRLLPEMLKIALKKYGHWSDEELQEYKMSHGHCVASRY